MAEVQRGFDEDESLDHALMVDGNAVAGLLYEIFAMEVTTGEAECVSCGKRAEIGSLLAFTQAPGVVLRCPRCENIVMRIVQTAEAIYLDARGVTYLRLDNLSRG